MGRRYCEVLLVHPSSGDLVADVYNTFPLNSCPPAKWDALDASAIAHENGAVAALLNGPRYWLMDSIAKTGAGHLPIKVFGGMAMYRDATVNLGTFAVASGNAAALSKPYVPHVVNRQASFTFKAGRTVYELWAPSGVRWVMQTWSQ